MREEVREKIEEVLRAEDARIHLVGVGGAGMSALARLLIGNGYKVSGSDLHASMPVERLVREGLVFYPRHEGTVVMESDLVVYSSAIGEGNPERLEAQRLGVPCVRRAEALAVLAARRQAIVVAGMHGKTTTSSMLTHVLRGAGKKPSHYIGAEVPILGASAGWDGDASSPMVIEGDESDGTLVAFRPAHAILLNIEEEHLDHYGDLRTILKTFAEFLDHTPGKVVYCADDENTALLCSNRKGAIGYGMGEAATYRAVNVTARNFVSEFEVLRDGARLGHVVLGVPGFQNVRNALGVITMAVELGVPFAEAAAALQEFRGATRRFEVRYKSENFMVVDDYAHHPTEIRATLAAARSGGWKRVVVLFQPHRYTRTQMLKEEFATAFAEADLLFLTEIYAASESPIEGVTGELFAAAVREAGHPKVHFEADLRKLWKTVAREIEPGDLVLTLGAGNIHEAAATLASELAWYEGLKKIVSAESVLLRQEPMRKHTSIRIGGPAQFWFEPASLDDLCTGLRYAKRHSVPVTFIGRGTNLLIRDGGIRGLSIHLGQPAFSKIEFDANDATKITVGAGAVLRAVVAAAKKRDLGGLSFMEGIPGNLGGALRMNAGAMQGWTMERVEEVKTVDRDGNVHIHRRNDLEVHYRSVPVLREEIAVEATLRALPKPAAQVDDELKEYSKKRWTSQPAAPSAGCIFKNPGTCPAGKLIDETGLKNLSFGKARVSDVHGNFIVNDGGATAEEVQTLMKMIQQRIKEARDIELDPEVIVMGEDL